MIGLLEQETGRKAEIEYLPMQPGDVKDTFADISAIERDHGFVPTGTVFLSRDGGYRAFSFERDGCSGVVYVSVAPINGGTLEMLYRFAGNSSRILFGYNGEIYDEPPIVRAYLTWKFWDLLFALKLTTALPQTDFLVIIAPMCCEAINTLPWQNI